MRPETAEWVAKAEGDFGTAEREAEVQLHANVDAVCFHSQQCAEKYLKAYLVEMGLRFPRTHDLLALLALAEPGFSRGDEIRGELALLAPFAVDVRYPGDAVDPQAGKEALDSCRKVRAVLAEALLA